jgi:hypothetical protein
MGGLSALIRFTKGFKERFGDDGVSRVKKIYDEYFTKLIERDVRVGYTRSNVWGSADTSTNSILLRRLDPHTIAHELMHLAQDESRNGIPQGERACDVYTNALGPDVAGSSTYIRTWGASPQLVSDCCREAVLLRARGLRNYIKYAETRLREQTMTPSRPS